MEPIYKNYLAWDCANKTLSWCKLKLCVNYPQVILYHTDKLATFLAREAFTELELIQAIREYTAAIKCFIIIEGCDVVNLLGKTLVKNTTIGERASALKAYLEKYVNTKDLAPDTTVIIEQQPNKIGFGGAVKVNIQSMAVSHQLAFYYSDYPVEFIDPKVKNNYCFAPHLSLEVFLDKYKHHKKAVYTARKEHTKHNFRYYLEESGNRHIASHIIGSLHDDVGDAFMSIIAYVARNRLSVFKTI